MAYDDDRIPSLALISAYSAEDLLSAARVKPRCRLIEDKHLGLHCDNTGYRRAALLSPGEVKRAAREDIVVDADKPRGIAYSAVYLRLIEPHILRTEGDITIYRLLKELILGVLKYESDAKAHVSYLFRILPDVASSEQHLTLSRAEQPAGELNYGRLSRAGVTDKSGYHALLKRYGEFFQRALLKRRSDAVIV